MRSATVCASAGTLSVHNAGLCAERRLIKRIKIIAIRKGVGLHGLSAWFYRVFGRIKVTRALADGSSACSMPCVCCAKALKHYKSSLVRAQVGSDAVERPNVQRRRPARAEADAYALYGQDTEVELMDKMLSWFAWTRVDG